jgi:two-component system, NarL family, nitrate/nitrite response regulator NarL
MQRSAEEVHVLLADDHHLVRSGIRSLLHSIPDVRVIAEVADGRELLGVLESVRPDVVITDISMPGLDGLAAISEIRHHHPDVRVMVLSMYDDAEIVKKAIANGACAYLRKDANDFELAAALHSVMTTGAYISAAVARQLLEPGEPSLQELLTERQIEIVTLLAQGKSTKEIGFALGLSSKTVDVHRSRIMDRLGIHDVAGLTIFAIRKGLVKI